MQIANLAGYVVGPSGVNWLKSEFLARGGKLTLYTFFFTLLELSMQLLVLMESGFCTGLPVLGGMFLSFYVATKVSDKSRLNYSVDL